MRIAGEAQRGRINEVDIPRNQGAKGCVRLAAGVFREQLVVIRFGHPPNNVHAGRNWTNYLRLFRLINRRLFNLHFSDGGL
jgi:hypothetical protein